MNIIRTRYAPSPTGYLHIGGARTALFSYLYAKHFNGEFIIRIEDTDIKRNVKDGEKSQIENLIWLGIVPDEYPGHEKTQYGKYRQSEKLERYNSLIEQLIEKGFAYKAYDTLQEILEQKQEQENLGIPSFRYDKKWLKISQDTKKNRENAGEFSIRLSLPKNKVYAWKDIVRGKIEVNTKDIGDFVIRKQDGYPTYNFAVVVDDHDMAISHVLRGEEHITNTPKQMVIYDLLDWEIPRFGHLTIITNMEGKKLSKRDSNTQQFISGYQKEGYSPEAIFNFLALLGWTEKHAKEKMTKDEFISAFDPQRLSKSPSKFDIKKMDWFGKEYFKQLPEEFILRKLNYTHELSWMKIFLEAYQKGAKNMASLQKDLNIYQNTNTKNVTVSNLKTKFPDAQIVVDTFENNLNDFSILGIQEAINITKNITNIKGKNLFMPLRLITTNQEHGPELAKAIFLFGEEVVLERLKHGK